MLDLRSFLVCPSCGGSLRWSDDELQCQACSHVYPIIDGIPVLLMPEEAGDECMARNTRHRSHKQTQISFYAEQVSKEFEITRPHGTPRLYRWLLGEKFRRSISGLGAVLPGATALTICGGSGMDSESLARAGCRVIASDISLHAVQRARERARRYGFPVAPLVADAEHLPFRDRAVDLVYVHDGLHHLEDPHTGLAEMARVADRAVSVSEPARARATAIAVALGLSVDREEAGNRVARVTLDEIIGDLRASGFRISVASRYAMYYRHEPKRIGRLLSAPVIFAAVQIILRVADVCIGRWGNKLAVTALRADAGTKGDPQQ